MRVLSLFSGVGGFDLGLESAGMTTAFQCEIDANCRQVLEYHWQDVPKWDNVTTLTGRHIMQQTGGVDVVAWGSPCQDLSIAGQRKGLQGEKSGLFHEGIRIIRELQKETDGLLPRISIWENVAGALSSNRGADFTSVLQSLADCGCHHLEWATLDAQYFGVAQRRRRVFVISIFDAGIAKQCANQILAVGDRSERDFSQSSRDWTGAAADASPSVNANNQRRINIDRKTFTTSFGLDTFSPWDETEIMRTLTTAGPHAVVQPTTLTPLESCHNTQIIDFVHSPARMSETLAPTLTAHMGTGGNNVPYVHTTNPAIRVRKLMPIECERLMGWKDNHTLYRADGKTNSDSVRYKMCGNGVASPVAQWIGEQLLEIIAPMKER